MIELVTVLKAADTSDQSDQTALKKLSPSVTRYIGTPETQPYHVDKRIKRSNTQAVGYEYGFKEIGTYMSIFLESNFAFLNFLLRNSLSANIALKYCIGHYK
jgi:hypothetical protein